HPVSSGRLPSDDTAVSSVRFNVVPAGITISLNFGSSVPDEVAAAPDEELLESVAGFPLGVDEQAAITANAETTTPSRVRIQHLLSSQTAICRRGNRDAEPGGPGKGRRKSPERGNCAYL